LEVDLENGVVTNLATGKKLNCVKLPKFLMELLKTEGLIGYYKLYKSFPWKNL